MNKIIVSIVLAVILIVGINKITDAIFYVEKPEKSAYQVASVTTVASTASDEESSANSESGNIMALFASTTIGISTSRLHIAPYDVAKILYAHRIQSTESASHATLSH